MEIRIGRPSVLRAEVQAIYDEGSMKWKRSVVVYTDLDPLSHSVEEAEEIVAAANRAMGESDAPDGEWRVTVLSQRDPHAKRA